MHYEGNIVQNENTLLQFTYFKCEGNYSAKPIVIPCIGRLISAILNSFNMAFPIYSNICYIFQKFAIISNRKVHHFKYKPIQTNLFGNKISQVSCHLEEMCLSINKMSAGWMIFHIHDIHWACTVNLSLRYYVPAYPYIWFKKKKKQESPTLGFPGFVWNNNWLLMHSQLTW